MIGVKFDTACDAVSYSFRSEAAHATASTAVAALEMLIFCGSCVFVITTRVLPESYMHAR